MRPICKYFSLVDKSFSHHLVPTDYHKSQTSELHAEDVPIPCSKLKESPLLSEGRKTDKTWDLTLSLVPLGALGWA